MQGLFRRRRLPHWDIVDGTYFVTSCLAGSIPARGLVELRQYKKHLDQKPSPDDINPAEWELRKHKLIFAQLDKWLDDRPLIRYFEKAELATIVRKSLYHFADQRYQLLAYVVMPSHVHWLFHPVGQASNLPEKLASQAGSLRHSPRTPREIIMHSMKSYTSNECNKVLKRTGQFWQDESYDHWVRDEDELLRIIEYIEQNPVKAGLVGTAEEYCFSSAHDRLKWYIPVGHPLVLQ